MAKATSTMFMIMCLLQKGRCRAGMQMTDDKVCRPRIKVPSPIKTVMNLPSGITVTEGILQDSFIVRHYNHVEHTNGAGWVCGILTRYPSSECVAGGWGWGVSVCMWEGGGDGGEGGPNCVPCYFVFKRLTRMFIPVSFSVSVRITPVLIETYCQSTRIKL